MKSLKPILQLSAYYLVLFGLLIIVLRYFPNLYQFLPIGGVENIASHVDEFMSGKAVPVQADALHQIVSFSAALFGVLLLMQPVAWVYMGARRRKGREQSFILTVILLPVVVGELCLLSKIH